MRRARLVIAFAISLSMAAAVPLWGEQAAESCGQPFRVVQKSFKRLAAPAYVWVDDIPSNMGGGCAPFQIAVVVGSAYPPFRAEEGRLERESFESLMKSVYGVSRTNGTVSEAALKTGVAVSFTAARVGYRLRVVSVQPSRAATTADRQALQVGDKSSRGRCDGVTGSLRPLGTLGVAVFDRGIRHAIEASGSPRGPRLRIPRVRPIRHRHRRRHGPDDRPPRSWRQGDADQRETGISTVKISGENGSFEFPAVRPGTYLVTGEKSGFALALVDNVQVQVGARMRVDLQLPVGQLTEKVEVSAMSPLIETDSSQRGQVITGDQTRALPLLSREYSALALLSSGVKLAGSSLTTGNTPREGAFNVNGLRSPFNNFLIDGVDNNAYGTSNQGFSNQVMQPPPDAVGEFKVVTNNMSAEFGRAAGATINVSYRSGTNAIHGTGWEFLRDTSMNASGYFIPTTGKPTLDRNQFGGVVGGPLVRSKAFFFGDYEGLRQTRKVTGFASIATPAQRQGILTVDVRDPRTGVVYPAGTPIAMTAFARSVLLSLPDTNLPGTANNFSSLQEFTADSNKAGVKIDVQASPSVSIFGRYGFRNLTTDDQPNIPLPSGGAGNGHIYAKNRQLVGGATWVTTTCRCSKCGSDTPGRRPERTRRRLARRAHRTSSVCRGCRQTAESPAVCRRRLSPATRTWGGRRPTRSGSTRPCTTRRSTTRG